MLTVSHLFTQHVHNGETANWHVRSLHFRAASLKLKQLLAARQFQNEQGKLKGLEELKVSESGSLEPNLVPS